MSANPALQPTESSRADQVFAWTDILLRSISFPVVLRTPKRMANGAQLAWLIDPLRKLAIVYRPGQQPETLLQPETLHGEGPVAGFILKMQRLWE